MLRASAERLSARAARSAARVCLGLSASGAWGAVAPTASASAGSRRGSRARDLRAGAIRMALPCPMVGMAGKQAGRAEQLFEQHRPGEQMRPGRLAEGEQPVRAVAV